MSELEWRIPMKWRLACGDILDQTADILICSANPFLTMSGGVGGAYLLRYGGAVQEELRKYLVTSGQRYVERGTVVVTAAGGGPYQALLHAVGVNALYETSPEIVCETLRNSLLRAAELQAVSVAVTAIGTGYGKMSAREFGRAIVPLLAEEFPPLREASLYVRKQGDFETVREAMKADVS